VREFAHSIELADRWSHSSGARSVAVHRIYALLEQEGTEPIAPVLLGTMAQLSISDRAPAAPHLLLALCVCGEFAAALSEADHCAKAVLDSTGSAPAIVDVWLFRGLAAAVCAGQRSERRLRRSRRAVLRACMRQVRHLARRGPDFAHYPLLLEAERLRLAGRAQSALALYERAARGAEQQHHHHHAGIVYERRAELLREQRRDSASAHDLHKASSAYERWGCARKVAALRDPT
jgi:tetratricopeptide (TPR) repeat protein